MSKEQKAVSRDGELIPGVSFCYQCCVSPGAFSDSKNEVNPSLIAHRSLLAKSEILA